MKERLLKLFSVKSIVTVILTVVFAHLSVCGAISADQYLTIFSVIIAFYFGTQHEKRNKEGGNDV